MFQRKSTPQPLTEPRPSTEIATIAKPGPTPIPDTKSENSNAPSWVYEEGVVIIGKNTRIGGSIGDCRILEVHGILEADVVAEVLIVREGGGVLGTIQVDRAEIHGIVEGTFTVHEHLDIAATGNVSGTISYQTLAVATGARLIGDITITELVPVTEDLNDVPFATVEPVEDDDQPKPHGKMNGKSVGDHANGVDLAHY